MQTDEKVHSFSHCFSEKGPKEIGWVDAKAVSLTGAGYSFTISLSIKAATWHRVDSVCCIYICEPTTLRSKEFSMHVKVARTLRVA